MESRVSSTIRLSPASHKHQQNITHREGANREKLWNETRNQIKYCPSIPFLQEVFWWNMNERTLFRQFAVHFVFVPFSYQDLYVRSIIQMPHAKYQMWPLSDFCHEIQNKYKHGRYTLCSGNNVVTKSWEKSSDNKCLVGTGTHIHAPFKKTKIDWILS